LVVFRAVFRAEALFFTDRVLALVGFFATFLAAFLAAGLGLRAAFLAAGACFRLEGAAFGVAAGTGEDALAGTAITGAGIPGVGMVGLGGVIVAAAGALIASSQPGVNISRRSREIALARPQRGQRAS
jgi:hypothetical protein